MIRSSFLQFLLISVVILIMAVLGYAGWKFKGKEGMESEQKLITSPTLEEIDKPKEEKPEISEIDTSEWETWNSNDYSLNCTSGLYCYNPLNYRIGVSFKYPLNFKDRGYQDMGGGLLLSSSDRLSEIYIDCTSRKKNELDEWFDLPKPTLAYNLIIQEDILINGHRGIETILEIKKIKDISRVRRVSLDKHRDIRFYMEKDNKVCWIQASFNIDGDILTEILSTFKSVY
jgi:hypothetical protein